MTAGTPLDTGHRKDLSPDFLYQVLDDTGGGTVGDIVVPDGQPSTDHEDGCVYRTAMDAGDDPSRKGDRDKGTVVPAKAHHRSAFVDVVPAGNLRQRAGESAATDLSRDLHFVR